LPHRARSTGLNCAGVIPILACRNPALMGRQAIETSWVSASLFARQARSLPDL